jgi:hypothetical protein
MHHRHGYEVRGERSDLSQSWIWSSSSDAQVGVPVLHEEPCAGSGMSWKARRLFWKASQADFKVAHNLTSGQFLNLLLKNHTRCKTIVEA